MARTWFRNIQPGGSPAPSGAGVNSRSETLMAAGLTAAPQSTVLRHRKGRRRRSVTARSYEQEGRAPVRLYTVDGGGHVAPNRHRKAIFVAGRTTRDSSVAAAPTAFLPVLGG